MHRCDSKTQTLEQSTTYHSKECCVNRKILLIAICWYFDRNCFDFRYRLNGISRSNLEANKYSIEIVLDEAFIAFNSILLCIVFASWLSFRCEENYFDRMPNFVNNKRSSYLNRCNDRKFNWKIIPFRME